MKPLYKKRKLCIKDVQEGRYLLWAWATKDGKNELWSDELWNPVEKHGHLHQVKPGGRSGSLWQGTVQKPVSVVVSKYITAYNMDNLHICDDTIIAEQ